MLKKQQDFQNFELLKQNEGHLNTIRDLEKKYDILNENIRKKSPCIRKSNGKTDKISYKTVSFDNKRSKSKHSKSTSPSSPHLSRPHNRHNEAHKLDYTSASERIIRMENEIEILTKKYNKLLSSSKNESNGLEKLKHEINKLAKELEIKNRELQKYKQKSSYLKD